MSFLIYTFQISFFLNALFYTDEYISNAYHNNGVLEFISGLPKSIYSLIATMIITNLLNVLSNSKSELNQVIRKLSHNINYRIIINNKLRKLRNKLIVYFIIIFTIGLFFCIMFRHFVPHIDILKNIGSLDVLNLLQLIILLLLSFAYYWLYLGLLV